MDQRLLEEMTGNFARHNIAVHYFHSADSFRAYLKTAIPGGSTVGIGNSRTLKTMNIAGELAEAGYNVLDKTLARTEEESEELKKRSLLAEWYLSGSNAVSAAGQIVNIDHSGNRVAAMIYGPDKVIIAVGVNKIEKNLEGAVNRARNTAAPLNASRAGYNPPCVQLNRCIDCDSRERVCNYLVTINGQAARGRMQLCIIEAEMGF